MEQDRIHRLKIATLLFKGTSDDLLFWVLIDTLFLTVVKGYTAAEVSLCFTVSFWVALLFKRFAYESIKKMRVGRALVFSAILFLASAVLLTFARSLPIVITGLCFYEIAPDFYDVSSILMRDICDRDTKGRDYVRSSALASTMYSVITLITALLIDPLMDVNPLLPMIICIVARVFSLALAVVIYARTKDISGLEQGRKTVLKGKIMSRSTAHFLYMAAMFGAFCALSISYLKLLTQDNLAVMYDDKFVITVYSYCIIATRVVKILGNATVSRAQKRGLTYAHLGVLLSISGILSAGCGLAGCILTGMPAIVVTVVGLLLVYFIYDPMLDITSFLSIENLNADQAIWAIYHRGLFLQLVSATASTIITVFMAADSYVGVMVLLILMSVLTLVFGAMGVRYYHLNARDYIKRWSTKALTSDNSLMLSAAMLMLHYGVVQSFKFNPKMLEARVGKIEDIGLHYRRFGFLEKRPYTLKGVYESFSDGYPCAVYGSYDGEYRWFPVLYADEEDALTSTFDRDPLFLNDFKDIKEQCVFTLKPRRKARGGS